MEKNERWIQIAKALFDSYVLTDVIGANLIIGAEIDQGFIKDLSKKTDCKKNLLIMDIFISCGRIDKGGSIFYLNERQENFVMSQIIKHLIKLTNVSLYEFENKFNALRLELNRQNPNLSLTIKELVDFIHPLYLEAIEEIFKK